MLVVSKKVTQRAHIKKAMDLRGKPGVYFPGTCFFGKGRYVFEFPEAPPAGMAKVIRQGARLHAEVGIKVLVRGGGVEFDDDSNAEYDETGEVKTASGGVASYPTPGEIQTGVLKAIAAVRKALAGRERNAEDIVPALMDQIARQGATPYVYTPPPGVALVIELGSALSDPNADLRQILAKIAAAPTGEDALKEANAVLDWPGRRSLTSRPSDRRRRSTEPTGGMSARRSDLSNRPIDGALPQAWRGHAQAVVDRQAA